MPHTSSASSPQKVALITGASSGIGKALAYALGKAGYRLVITGRNMEKLMSAEQDLRSKGIDCTSVVADASSEVDASIAAARAYKQYGRLDVLVCNAGISMRALFEEVDLQVLHQVMDTNFWGAVNICKFALPEIKKNKGVIVAVSSIAGHRGLPARTGYSASKFAMQGFFEALRTELLYTGVHVLVACPGFTSSNIRNTALSAQGTPQQESPLDESRIMSAEEVAEAIRIAIEKRQRDLVLTSQGKLTVWLNKLFPSLMDTLVFRHFSREKDSPLRR